MFFIYCSGCCFESVPDFFAKLACYRTKFVPVFMQFLQLTESRNHIFFVSQHFGSFAQFSFCFQIFLEIVFPEFVVYLDQIPERLLIQVVLFPKFVGCCRRYRTGVFPVLLQLTKCSYIGRHIIVTLDQLFHLLNNVLFFQQIIAFLLFLLSIQFCFIVSEFI